MAKQRLDRLLVERGLAESRERAQALILAGQVVVGEHAAHKAGQLVDEGAPLRLKGEAQPFASRGGLKLAAALGRFGLDPAGLRCLDVGASTGGFTDVLLRRGAAAVCALDVGHDQLAWKLRTDARVTVLDGVNARHLDARAGASSERAHASPQARAQAWSARSLIRVFAADRQIGRPLAFYC